MQAFDVSGNLWRTGGMILGAILKNKEKMVFPFEVTYKKRLEGDIKEFSTLEILEFFKKDFEESGVDNVELINDCLIVKNEWIGVRIRPGLNWNRWNGVVYAKLQIKKDENKNRIAIYTFNVSKILIIGLLAGITVVILGWSVISLFDGLIVFGFIGVINWAFALFQHQLSFDDFIHEKKYNLSNNTLERLEKEIKEEKK